MTTSANVIARLSLLTSLSWLNSCTEYSIYAVIYIFIKKIKLKKKKKKKKKKFIYCFHCQVLHIVIVLTVCRDSMSFLQEGLPDHRAGGPYIGVHYQAQNQVQWLALNAAMFAIVTLPCRWWRCDRVSPTPSPTPTSSPSPTSHYCIIFHDGEVVCQLLFQHSISFDHLLKVKFNC